MYNWTWFHSSVFLRKERSFVSCAGGFGMKLERSSTTEMALGRRLV